MSASARSPLSAAVVAELQSRHGTEVRSYASELWDGDDAKASASLATFWREWEPPPGGADEIPREFVFAAVRRLVIADQRRAGAAAAETEVEAEAVDQTADAGARIAARFRRLTSKQQEMVRLHLKHRFDLDEIAEIADLTPANAAQVLHTAIGRLNGSAHDDSRAVRLALAGASGDALAGETPERRAHVAELRLTLEATRQVLARGGEKIRPREKRGSRSPLLWTLAGVVVLLVGAGMFAWMRRGDAEPEAAEDRPAVGGLARVTIPRAAAGEAERESTARSSGPRAQAGNSARRTAPSASRPVRASEASPETARPTAIEADRETRTAKALASSATSSAAPVTAEPERKREPAAAVAAVSAPSPRALPAAAVPEASAVSASEVAEKQPTLRDPEQKPLRPLADKLDTAPIAALRKALAASRWPDRRDVNVGALLGAAPPSSEPPRGEAPVFSTRVESSVSPWDSRRRIVRVAVRAREDAPAARAAATVILLLDVSGSMDAPNRLPLVQAAVAGLLRRLRPEDRVGIVTYAGEPTVLLPPAPLTNEREVRGAIDALEAKGRTNGGAGLREAFAMAAANAGAGREQVVILCTDGDFNMGATSEAELGALIDGQRDSGVRLAIFGFGRPDRIDARLEALAARARGGSGYVNTRAEAEQALVSQLDRLFAPVAEQVNATVEFDPARVARVRRIGDEEMTAVVRGAEIPIAQRSRVLPGETLSALFEVELAAGAGTGADGHVPSESNSVIRSLGGARLDSADDAWRVRVAARVPGGDGQSPYYGLSSGAIGAGEFAAATVDFRFAVAAGLFGEVLQAGPERTERLDDVARWARGAVGEDAGGYRAELIAWVEQAQRAARR